MVSPRLPPGPRTVVPLQSCTSETALTFKDHLFNMCDSAERNTIYLLFLTSCGKGGAHLCSSAVAVTHSRSEGL